MGVLILLLTSCKRTEDVQSTIEEINFAGYQFEVIESTTIEKRTGRVIERSVDTILVISCDHCKELCHEGEEHQDYRR